MMVFQCSDCDAGRHWFLLEQVFDALGLFGTPAILVAVPIEISVIALPVALPITLPVDPGVLAAVLRPVLLLDHLIVIPEHLIPIKLIKIQNQMPDLFLIMLGFEYKLTGNFSGEPVYIGQKQ